MRGAKGIRKCVTHFESVTGSKRVVGMLSTSRVSHSLLRCERARHGVSAVFEADVSSKRYSRAPAVRYEQSVESDEQYGSVRGGDHGCYRHGASDTASGHGASV